MTLKSTLLSITVTFAFSGSTLTIPVAEAQTAFRQMGAVGYVARLQARLDALDNQAADQVPGA